MITSDERNKKTLQPAPVENPGYLKPPVKSTFTFFILAICCAVILLVTIFLLGFEKLPRGSSGHLQEQVRILSDQLTETGEDSSFIEAQTARLATIPSEQDRSKQYQKLWQTAFLVNSRYSTTHNPKLHKLMGSFDEFAQSNYAEFYSLTHFYQICLDEECGTLDYPEEIEQLEQKVLQADIGYAKQAVFDALYEAAIAKPEDRLQQFNAYNYARGLLKQEANLGNDEASVLAQEFEEYLKREFTDLYSQIPSEEEILKQARRERK